MSAMLPDRRRAAGLGLTVAGFVLMLVVVVPMALARNTDKVDSLIASDELKRLKKSLRESPGDQALKDRVRGLDHQLRRDLFTRLRFSAVGTYMLLGAAAVFLVGARLTVARDARPANPLEWAPRADHEQDSAGWQNRLALVATALALACGAWLVSMPNVPLAEALAGADAVPALMYPSIEARTRNWPGFRGVGGHGVAPTPAESGAYLTEWSGASGEGILWRAPLFLPGISSPVVWGDCVFLTGADARRKEVYCFDADTGDLRWRSPLIGSISDKPKEKDTINDEASAGHAASTAVTDGQFVYAIFGDGVIAAFEFSGRQMWIRNLGPLENSYRHASSLAMAAGSRSAGVLLVLLDQGDPDAGLSKLLGLNPATGKTLWKTTRPVFENWSSPIITPGGERDLIVTTANPWVIAYDVSDGKEVWRAGGENSYMMAGETAPSPIGTENLTFVVSPGDRITAIRNGGRGDITKTHETWFIEDDAPEIVSPVSDGRRLYVLGLYLTCYDLKDGKKIWQTELLEQRGKEQIALQFNASPVFVRRAGDDPSAGWLYMLDESGTMVVAQTGQIYRETARSKLPDTFSASPAFAGGRIFLRGAKHLYALGNE
jgi:outer membrane protein assembly factor BamB